MLILHSRLFPRYLLAKLTPKGEKKIRSICLADVLKAFCVLGPRECSGSYYRVLHTRPSGSRDSHW